MKSRCNLAVSIVESRHKTRSPMLSELWDYVFPCPSDKSLRSWSYAYENRKPGTSELKSKLVK